MRTPYRIATTAVALAAVFPIGVGPANAQSAGESAAAGAYFSRTTPAKTDEMPADPGPYFVRLNTDRVAETNLAVAVAQPGQSDKESFLYFELASVLGLTVDHTVSITKAIVTVPLQPNDAGNQSANVAPENVKACASGPEGFADGVDAGAYDEKPVPDCKLLDAVAKATTDGSAYEFDITPLAQTWVTEINDGIALVPAQTETPFQIVFQPRDKATVAVEYTATPLAGPTVDPSVTPTTPPVPPVGGTYVPPVNTGTVNPPVAQPPAPQPKPTVAPRPTVAPPPQQVNTVSAGFVEDGDLNAMFWLAALVGIGLIGAISLFLGNPEVPVTSSTMQNGVGRALDERRRVAGRSGVRVRTV